MSKKLMNRFKSAQVTTTTNVVDECNNLKKNKVTPKRVSWIHVFFQYSRYGLSLSFFVITSFLLLHIIELDVQGTVYVGLGLLESVSLCLIRDGFRKTCLRLPQMNQETFDEHWTFWKESIRAVCTLGRKVTLIIVLICCFFLNFKMLLETQSLVTPSTSYQICFLLCTVLVSLGVIITTVIEEKVIYVLIDDPFCRVKADAFTGMVRKMTIISLYFVGSFIFPKFKQKYLIEFSLLTYSFGQLMNGVGFFYWFYFRQEQSKNKIQKTLCNEKMCDLKSSETLSCTPNYFLSRCLGPSCLKEHAIFLPIYCHMSISTFVSSEAERFALLFLFPSHSWTAFTMASNLAGIFVRTVLSPLADKISITCCCCSSSSFSQSLTHSSFKEKVCFFFLLEACFGVIIACFGPPISASLFVIFLNKEWIICGAHEIFSLYCYYISLLCFNSCLESFILSTGLPNHLNEFKKIQPLLCGITIMTSYILKNIYKHIYSSFFQPQLFTTTIQSIYLMNALVKASCFSSFLRLLVLTYYTMEYWDHQKEKDSTRSTSVLCLLQQKKRAIFNNKIASLFRSHFYFFLPCCVGGILSRLFMYRHQGVTKTLWILFQEPITKELSLQAKVHFIMPLLKKIAMKEIVVHSCLVFISFFLTFLLNQKYLKQFSHNLKQFF